jgi:thioredoxin reductase (NADPH)
MSIEGVGDPIAFPRLTDAQLARLRAYGEPRHVEAGDVLYRPGDPIYDLFVLDGATVEMVVPATSDAPEKAVVRFGPGSFLGELNMLTGQSVFLTARVVEGGPVRQITRERLRRLMADDAELVNILLEVFRARRELLTQNDATRGRAIVGSGIDTASLALRTYALPGGGCRTGGLMPTRSPGRR